MAWVSWSRMCKSKLEGGMGFRDLYAFNLAMLAKQGWRMLENPASLMACMYEARYFPNGDILNASIGSNLYYAWRSIHKSIEIIQPGTRWRVGNGKTIHIWDDRWLPTPSTYKVISPRKDFGDFPMLLALIDQDTRRWRKDILDKIFFAFEVGNILSIPIPHYPQEDQLIWVKNKK
ncbi:putative mitochondrial protein AtMg00310 [Castanea sativa]|uniref:putative mitochondrial protein AtMg00310 n=1 Tax=Castanea sativa TaxID=21020 RepID=UPI003F652F69